LPIAKSEYCYWLIFSGKPGIPACSAGAQQGGQAQVQQNQTKVNKTLVNSIAEVSILNYKSIHLSVVSQYANRLLLLLT
jgi:hypothetical protein